MEMWRTARWMSYRANNIALFNTLALKWKFVTIDFFHVPVKRIKNLPTREEVFNDHNAFFGIPPIWIAVSHPPSRRRADWIAVAPESHIDPGVESTERRTIHTEIIIIDTDAIN